MLKLLRIALLLLFGWLALDAVASLLFGAPLEGVHYPLASGTLRGLPRDWSDKSRLAAPLYFAVFATLWLGLAHSEGARTGTRVAAWISTFTVAPFWIVPLVSADLHGLVVNGWWAASMAFANTVFLLYGLVGSGRSEDLRW